MATTKDQVRKRAHNFRGANREFSQEMPPLVDDLLELIEDAEGPEVVDSLISNSKTKALSANQGKVLKTLVDAKVDTPESTGEPGQVLQLDANGDPDWVTPTAGTTPDSVMSDDSTNAIQNKVVKKYVDDIAAEKANIDGYYASLVSGAAENLVGHGSVPAEYTFRTSGGDADLGTGVAQIKEMKGNSIVWNQLIKNGTFANNAEGWIVTSGATKTVANGVISVKLTATGTAQSLNVTLAAANQIQYIAGHKYLFLAAAKSDNDKTYFNLIPTGVSADGGSGRAVFNDWTLVSLIWTKTGTTTVLVLRGDNTGNPDSDVEFSVKNVMCFDLTQMFGEGKEPSTVEEFKALYPLLYYAYTSGVIVNNGAAKIKTVGFNQWDEVAESGTISSDTGENSPSDSYIRSKNYIRIVPGQTYYASGKIYPRYYDAGKNYIGYGNSINNATFTPPEGAVYLRFATEGTSYQNNICINLSWSGYKNGTYEPYWESELVLNTKTITGKVGGEGESETIFPEGMRRAGTAHDSLIVDADGYARRAIKRIGSVDMGDCEWTKASTADEHWCFRTTVDNMKQSASSSTVANLLCTKYSPVTPSNTYSGVTGVAAANGSDYIFACDEGYSDADTFEAAMDGVELLYELATPVEYTLDEPIYMGYRVDDFGTEERLPADTASEVQAPIYYDVQYAMNAVDTIRRLPQNYVSKDSFDNFCTELATKLGAAMGKTISIEATYDAETMEYDYSISITDTEEQTD
jgi:hypothetical protein